MGESARKKTPSAAMAAVLRNSRGATSPQDLEARLHDLRPITPSAEYVALANQAMGREPDGAAYMEGVRQRERELGGMYALPLAPKASARLPSRIEAPPQGSLASAEVVARAKQLGMTSPDAARAGRQRAFAGAQAAGGPDPRLLAALLRAGR